ncbi:MAG TPA: hypothetical protein DCY13_24430 [Verrucomicrobiales bacterium]|nr:hypothetical protein [Verrucomicrobiales bacterium]
MNRNSLPSARRFLVVDVGSRCLKALLVSSLFGRIRVHAHRIIGLDETSQPGSVGWSRVLQELTEELGSHPLAVSVPQHATDSQVLDLPGADARTIREQIQQDVVKLSGLSESAIIYDYGQLQPFAQYTNPFWVTHARESEVLNVVRQFEALEEDIWEITSTGNALVAAYREAGGGKGSAVLVDLGSAGTVVSIVYQGQGRFVTSFAVGGLLFAEQIRLERECPAMEAEFAKNTEDLLTGDRAMPTLRQLVDRWHGELVRIIEDWISEHPLLNISASQFEVVLSGGDAEMPGLLEYLRANSVLAFRRWSELNPVPALQPAGQFAVVYGLAVTLLRRTPPSTSLVPEEMRSARTEHGAMQLLHAGTWLVLMIAALVLGFGTWQKYYLIQEVERQLSSAREVLSTARRIDQLKLQLAGEYEEVRPVLARQQQTIATIRTLGLLSTQMTPSNSWYVLFADADSYFNQPQLPAGTNAPPTAPASTNVLSRLTNAFVAELSTPLDATTARALLTDVIEQFKRSPLFRKVDILPPDQRRRLVPDGVLVPGGHYALSFSMNENEFQRPVLTGDEIRQLMARSDAERTNAGRGPVTVPTRRGDRP